MAFIAYFKLVTYGCSTLDMQLSQRRCVLSETTLILKICYKQQGKISLKLLKKWLTIDTVAFLVHSTPLVICGGIPKTVQKTKNLLRLKSSVGCPYRQIPTIDSTNCGSTAQDLRLAQYVDVEHRVSED